MTPPDRFAGITRVYSTADVDKLRGSIKIEHTLARLGAERMWALLHSEPYVPALGALTGNQAIQMVASGLKAIYLSGWQVSSDTNSCRQLDHRGYTLLPCVLMLTSTWLGAAVSRAYIFTFSNPDVA